MRLFVCMMLASLFAVDSIADEHTTIIHAGTLLAVPGDAPQNNQSLLKAGKLRGSKMDSLIRQMCPEMLRSSICLTNSFCQA